MLLALSSNGDVTTDYVIRAVEALGGEIIRINTDDLLGTWQMRVTPKGAELEDESRRIDLSRISAVYYRRAYSPRPSSKIAADAWDFVRREARVALRGLYAHLECYWISQHLMVVAAENKPRQLRLAARLGFNVPETLITTDPEAARAFIAARKSTIVKALSYGDLGAGMVSHTSLLYDWSDDLAPEITACPTLLQRAVEKSADWRVTVVEDQLFACRIDSQSNSNYAVDMRRGLADLAMEHSLGELPEDVSMKCVALVKELGLAFGAIDLVQDKAGVFWFLEINPNGQWAWIEDRTDAPISRAIAKALIKR